MNEIAETNNIERKIYNIRGVEVMLDSDLAEQYKCANDTKSINLAVKRNRDRFPNDFYFQFNEQLLPRKYLLLEEKLDKNIKRIDELFDKFNPKVITNTSIFFKNDIYDAYSVLLEIFSLAKEQIIIIDNYIRKIILDELRKVNKIFHLIWMKL